MAEYNNVGESLYAELMVDIFEFFQSQERMVREIDPTNIHIPGILGDSL